MEFMKRFFAVLLAAVLVSSMTICAFAADGNVTYSGDAGSLSSLLEASILLLTCSLTLRMLCPATACPSVF